MNDAAVRVTGAERRPSRTKVHDRSLRFVRHRRLGGGGCGEVYLARDRHRRADVAIKIATPGNEARLEHEAQILRQLSHHNIVRFTEYIDHDDEQLLVVEYLPGGSLAERLTRGAVGDPWSTALAASGLAGALREIHAHGLVHADIEPGNLLIRTSAVQTSAPSDPCEILHRGEELVVADFGIADTPAALTEHRWGTYGTRLYRSPQQEDRGAPIDQAVDVYGATAVIVSIIGGGLPPAQHQLDAFCGLLRPKWRAFVATGMHRDAARRHSSIERWHQALMEAVNHDLTEGGHDAI